MQPIIIDPNETLRFKPNQIVEDLYNFAQSRGMGMNEIVIKHCRGNYSQDDLCQLYQLIGYSLSGYHELNNVSDEHAKAASEAAKLVDPKAMGCRDMGCSIHTGVPLEDE